MDVDKDFSPFHRAGFFGALVAGAHVQTAVVQGGVDDSQGGPHRRPLLSTSRRRVQNDFLRPNSPALSFQFFN